MSGGDSYIGKIGENKSEMLRQGWKEWEDPGFRLRIFRDIDLRAPQEWEAARRAAVKLGKEKEFHNFVREYREQVGTEYLQDPSVVRKTVEDPDLEAILLGASVLTT